MIGYCCDGFSIASFLTRGGVIITTVDMKIANHARHLNKIFNVFVICLWMYKRQLLAKLEYAGEGIYP